MSTPNQPVYLDYCATTPVDPAVAELIMHHMVVEFGNAGSRTHEYGARAKQATERARRQVAAAIAIDGADVVFTSGATESNNLAILGLAEYGRSIGRTHIITTAIEHKSVLEPCRHLEATGFRVSRVKPRASGAVVVADIAPLLGPDTLLVSIQHANNETGVIQPIREVAEIAVRHGAVVHVDAAQTFCKVATRDCFARVDLVSISGHKVGGPKGVGALAIRRSSNLREKLRPLIFGGGQEYGLRPGTVPVPLVAGLGLASELRDGARDAYVQSCASTQEQVISESLELGFSIIGHGRRLPNCLALNNDTVDAEVAFVALKNLACISNGSACTSNSRSRSHVLDAMGLASEAIDCTIRIAWDHNSDPGAAIGALRAIAAMR